MQPLSPDHQAPTAWPRSARAGLVALFTLGAMAAQEATAAPPCPWIVQQHPQPVGSGAPDKASAPAIEVIFEGTTDETGAFYGFSVASADLAAELADVSRLPDLSTGARRLEPVRTALGTRAWRVAADTLKPYVVYLAAARAPLNALEAIGARIEPARPLTALAMRTRGGSDQSGPLPHRSLPGYPLAAAESEAMPDVQICAYQVAMR